MYVRSYNRVGKIFLRLWYLDDRCSVFMVYNEMYAHLE